MRSSYYAFCDRYELDPKSKDAKDQFAEFCRQYDLLTEFADKEERKKPGRKPKLKSGAMTPAERKMAERERRKQNGEVQVWVSPEEMEMLKKWRAEVQ